MLWRFASTLQYSLRRSLPRSALTTLVTSFTMSKVDYCNVALAGLPQYELDRVQSVVNAAARHTAIAAVCTVDCAIEIVLITLHYITLLITRLQTWTYPLQNSLYHS